MHTEKINVHLVSEEFDEKGRRYWTEKDKIEEVEMKAEGRHHIFCNMCGWPTYPDCPKDCSVLRNHPIKNRYRG